MPLTIADETVELHEAARWLLQDYEPAIIEFYDCAGTSAPVRSSTDGVDLEDLGRLVCVAASLTYERGHTLLQEDQQAPWPAVDISPLAEIEADEDDFYGHPAVDALWNLFRFWCERDGLNFGTVGKLLHIKWPQFVPITDSAFTSVYRSRAVEKHNTSDHIREELGDQRHRRSRANVRAYWSAFHDDLVDNELELQELREEFDRIEVERGPAEDHRSRLKSLSDVRLLDALAWGAEGGRGLARITPQ